MTTLLQSAELIAAELVARLSTRTIAQGAETDLGVRVYQGRRYIDNTMIPCAVLLEGDDVPDRLNIGTQYAVDQKYVLMAYLPCDPNNPNVAAHAGIRDLKRAVFSGDGRAAHTLGNRVKTVEYLGRDIGPRADGEAFVLALIEVSVRYVEDVSSP